jgi:geranylgeranylglycerol-phosphate geranylgeranyltransferase
MDLEAEGLKANTRPTLARQIRGLYKISRPHTTLTGVLAVILGGYVAGTGEWFAVGLAALSTLLISAAANAWNDTLDLEIDRINQPHRPLPSGMVSPQTAKRFSFVLAVLGVVVAAFISWQGFLIALFANVLLYIYSWRLKSTVLLGNAAVALVSALSAIFGGVAAGNPRPSLWLGLIIFVAILGREVLKTLADYEGDLRQQCRTISTVWGRRWARVVFFVLAGATVMVMMLPSLLEVYRPIYAYIVVLGVYPVIIYVLLRVTRDRTGPQLERLSQLMKLDFMVWFTAVIFGASI